MSANDQEALPTLGDAYHIERELGGGGMSRVFVATEVALNRRVVVKVLGRALAEGLSAERFAREIALAAALQDPHIVPVHATGTTGEGLPFFTMPFVEGESLRVRMQRGPVPLDEALRILRDIAEALEYAHTRGIVHRDIKPENVLLSGRSAVVADFGIAKALAAARAQGEGQGAGATLTSVGMSLGTPAYMSPEQAAGDPADHRADLYAWGMVAYELLAGKHPFLDRGSMQQLIAAQITEMPPPLDEMRPGLPPTLGALVMRCLAKAPAERPESATALLATLGTTGTAGAVSTGDASGVRVAVAMPRGRRVGLAVVLAVLLLGFGGVWLARKGGAAAASADATPGLAVLPFEHQGDSADAYITEGLSDELRGRLAGVRDLTVIARGSSVRYRGSSKTPREIAEELGVRWLLTATVQVIGSGETRRVIVRPELVEVMADGQPRSRWGEPFDATGADALRLQGDIAGRVVDAMEVKLVSEDRARTIALPTTDAAAYDAYLRGRAALEWGANSRLPALNRAVTHYEEAVQRDPAYLDAWLGLAYTRALQVANGRTVDPALVAKARTAVNRVEALAPGSPQSLLARSYFVRVIDADYDSTRVLLEQGARMAPGDTRFAGNLGLLLHQNLGRSAEAAAYFRRVTALDPSNINMHASLALALGAIDSLTAARAAAERAHALLPSSANTVRARVFVELRAGDTTAARTFLRRAMPAVTDGESAVLLGYELGWLFDDATLTRLLALDEAAISADRGEWALYRAVLFRYRGDREASRAWADTARRVLARGAAQPSAGSRIIQDLAAAAALAGQVDQAITAAVRTRAMLREQWKGRGMVYASSIADLAVSMAAAGARDSAIAWLADPALADVGFSGKLLAVDPRYVALRDDPRFRVLAGLPPR